MDLYHTMASKWKDCRIWDICYKREIICASSVSLVRKLTRNLVSMFWLGSCPTNFHKTIENPSCNFASHKYKSDYLLRRHASNGSLHRGDKHVLRHSNLLVKTSAFCNQLEEVCFDTSAGNRIFGTKNQLSQPRNISRRGGNTESNNKMSKFTDRTRNIAFRINKSDWFVWHEKSKQYCQQSYNVSILQQISYLEESHSYQQKIVLSHQSKTELQWWIINTDLYNGWSLIQPPAQVYIQTGASRKGWGQAATVYQ